MMRKTFLFGLPVHIRRHQADEVSCWVLALRRPSFFSSVFLVLWPYILLDTILLLPILIICQVLCLVVIFDTNLSS